MSKKLTKKEMEMAQYWHRKAFALLVNQKISTVLWREWDEYDKETGLVMHLKETRSVIDFVLKKLCLIVVVIKMILKY